MNVTTEGKRLEATIRLRSLSIPTETIKQFAEEGCVGISESLSGQFHRAEGEDLERIRQVEAECDALVYLVIRNRTDAGMVDGMLFVNDYPKEWWKERRAITLGGPIVAYIHNFDAPDRSGVNIIGIAGTVGTGLRLTRSFPPLTDIFKAIRGKAR